MSIVFLGNPEPQHLHPGEDTRRAAEHLRQSVTRVELWDGFDDPEGVERALSTSNDRDLVNRSRGLADEHRRFAVAVHEIEELWPVHSGAGRPSWVASDDPELQAALARYFGCEQGEPVALITNGGRDALHAQHLSTSAQPAAFNYGALSANSTAAAATDTTLAGEITTAGGGLLRAQMTYAHTAGTNTSTLTKTWTANGTDVLPVTIAKWASFNASSAGTMGEEALLSSTVTLSTSGDSITVTYTLSVG